VNHLKEKKGVPDFWYKVFKNCDMMEELLKDKDEEILKSLVDVTAKIEEKPK